MYQQFISESKRRDKSMRGVAYNERTNDSQFKDTKGERHSDESQHAQTQWE